MTFSYDGTLPNPPNDPADDVDQMQTNSASISSLIAIDHTGFNVALGGTHKQVTFASDNPPAVPTTPPVLFTNTQDGAAAPNTLPGGIPGLFFYSGTATQGQRNNIVAAKGSVVLFGGIIIKWGTISFTASSKAVVFATDSSNFPNNLFSIILTAFTTTPAINGTLGYVPTGAGTGGFTAYQLGSNPLTASYIAIGN